MWEAGRRRNQRAFKTAFINKGNWEERDFGWWDEVEVGGK